MRIGRTFHLLINISAALHVFPAWHIFYLLIALIWKKHTDGQPLLASIFCLDETAVFFNYLSADGQPQSCAMANFAEAKLKTKRERK